MCLSTLHDISLGVEGSVCVKEQVFALLHNIDWEPGISAKEHPERRMPG